MVFDALSVRVSESLENPIVACLLGCPQTPVPSALVLLSLESPWLSIIVHL